jgi:protein-L-isoaspartate(D-aspartate) O-methyltransferase
MNEQSADNLIESGHLTPDWRPSFLAVPREIFIPDTIWRQDTTRSGPDLVPLRKDEYPEMWHELASGDDSVITQVDDGHPVGPGGIGDNVTSSASMPRVVALMLKHLAVHDGQRVLEIGTGTGWNAALLAHRLGPDHVTSIEIDSAIAAHARTALTKAGYGDVTVISADGKNGYPPHAPYDRLIATVACTQMPYAWIAQIRPAGRIVAPCWALDYHGLLAVLTVTGDGSAVGQFVDDVSFMRLRYQRINPRYQVFSYTDEENEHATVTETDIHPAEVASPDYALGAIIAIGTRVTGCRMSYFPSQNPDSNDGILWLIDHDSLSWARLYYNHDNGAPYPVRQYGARRLWDEVEAAHTWWVEQGKPDADHWRFTVTPQGQQIELVTA